MRYITGGHVRGFDPGRKVQRADDVGVWVNERLEEYVEVLGGLLQDKEESLRVSENQS